MQLLKCDTCGFYYAVADPKIGTRIVPRCDDCETSAKERLKAV